MPGARLLAGVATLVVLLAGCSGSADSGPDSAASSTGHTAPDASGDEASAAPSDMPAGVQKYYQQTVHWKACDGGLQCAHIKVPLNYDKPEAGSVSLAMSRKKASTGKKDDKENKDGKDGKSAKKVGSLLVNPGGPGGSAIDYLKYSAATGYPRAVRSHFDLVAFDPRGVAKSTPVRCLSDSQMDTYTATDTTPDDASEVHQLQAEMKTFADGCEKRSGKLLPHVSTEDAARDMDVVRAVLGDTKLNYVGKSYGTFLGATYADLFPQRTGRMVLDGALDPSATALEANRVQASGFETAFTSFVKDCVSQDSCPLGTSQKAAGKKFDALLDKLDSTPLPTRKMHGRKLTESLATTGVLNALYAEQLWPALRSGLADALDGDGSTLLKLSDQYYERGKDGNYSNLMYANAAVDCLDLPPAVTSEKDVRAALPSFEKASPHFGRNLAWAGLSCAQWPVKATGKPHQIHAKGAAPIVVVGTTRDPATPYSWAKALAGQLDSGRLLTYDGDGHTAYARGSSCVDQAVNRFLVHGKPPEKEKRC